MIDQLIHLWIRGWRSAFEIVLLTVAIYYGYLYFRGTRGAKVLTGLALVFLTLTLISTLLNLVVIGWIVRSFSVFLAVALVVIFQPELRRGLAALGGHPIFSLTSEKRETVHDLAEAVTQLANKQFGALIAIERHFPLIAAGLASKPASRLTAIFLLSSFWRSFTRRPRFTTAELSFVTAGSQQQPAFFQSVSGRHWIAAWDCVIARVWELPKSPMPWR